MQLIEGPVALLIGGSWNNHHEQLHTISNRIYPTTTATFKLKNQIATLTHTGIISSTNVPNVVTEWMIILVTNLKSSSSGGRVCFVQCGHLYLIFSTVSSLCINQSMALNDWYDVKLPGIVCMLWTSSFCNYHQFVVRKGPRDANEITAKHQQCKGLSFNPHKLQILSLSRNLALSPESSCQANCTKRIHTFLSKI